MPLKPSEVLLVVSPRLLLQLARRQVLLVCALLVVKNEEERVHVELFKHGGRVEDRRGRLREGAGRGVWVSRHVCLRPLRVGRLGHVEQRQVEHLQHVCVGLLRLVRGGGRGNGGRQPAAQVANLAQLVGVVALARAGVVGAGGEVGRRRQAGGEAAGVRRGAGCVCVVGVRLLRKRGGRSERRRGFVTPNRVGPLMRSHAAAQL
mmetsp:Transcript_1314/g.2706  ORF Transcript_1314/g.2706 Transcript_1314/m.2706 type:complete len:205 (-) Transcript_1314:194-808(-)